jgi:hypothetical protein
MMFEVGATYCSDAIGVEAFRRLADGTPMHVCRALSRAPSESVISRSDILYKGVLPDWVFAAFETETSFLLFVERAADAFVFLGQAKPVMLRTHKGSDRREMMLHLHDAEIPTSLLEVVAPEVLA